MELKKFLKVLKPANSVKGMSVFPSRGIGGRNAEPITVNIPQRITVVLSEQQDVIRLKHNALRK
jgi:hypothetical protein